MAWWQRDRGRGSADAAEPLPARTQAWREVPVLQRVVKPTPPVAEQEGFSASLASWRDPRSLAPLTHAVDPLGPSGSVTGLVDVAAGRAVPAAAAPAMPLRVTVRRPTASRLAVLQRWWSPDAAPAPQAPPAEPGAVEQTAEAVPDDVPEGPVHRRLPVVTTSPGEVLAGLTSAVPVHHARSVLPVVASTVGVPVQREEASDANAPEVDAPEVDAPEDLPSAPLLSAPDPVMAEPPAVGSEPAQTAPSVPAEPLPASGTGRQRLLTPSVQRKVTSPEAVLEPARTRPTAASSPSIGHDRASSADFVRGPAAGADFVQRHAEGHGAKSALDGGSGTTSAPDVRLPPSSPGLRTHAREAAGPVPTDGSGGGVEQFVPVDGASSTSQRLAAEGPQLADPTPSTAGTADANGEPSDPGDRPTLSLQALGHEVQRDVPGTSAGDPGPPPSSVTWVQRDIASAATPGHEDRPPRRDEPVPGTWGRGTALPAVPPTLQRSVDDAVTVPDASTAVAPPMQLPGVGVARPSTAGSPAAVPGPPTVAPRATTGASPALVVVRTPSSVLVDVSSGDLAMAVGAPLLGGAHAAASLDAPAPARASSPAPQVPPPVQRLAAHTPPPVAVQPLLGARPSYRALADDPPTAGAPTVQRRHLPDGQPPRTGGERRPAPVVQRIAAPPPVDPGAVAVAAGVAQRDVDGSVVFAPPPGPTSGWPGVQRTDDATAAAPPPAPEPPAPVASAAPAPAAPAAPTAADLDELARRLFPPLTARLKAELRLDRERAGMLTDLRR